MKLAVQLYTLRNDYNTPSEFIDILKKVKEIGFEGVEFAGFGGLTAEEIKENLDAIGLKAVGCHMGLDDFDGDKIYDTIKAAQIIGMKTVGIGGAPHDTAEDIKKISDVFIRANKIGKEYGIKFYYHNHHQEFHNPINGQLPMDLIKAATYLEVDTYWSFFAGVDNYKFITENKDKIVHLHIKDGNDGHPCALGEGQCDIKSVFKAAKEIGIEWLILEDDEPKPNGVEDIKRSMRFFKENL